MSPKPQEGAYKSSSGFSIMSTSQQWDQYAGEEDQRIYGLGPERLIPYTCPVCNGNAKLVVKCDYCNRTALVWGPSTVVISDPNREDTKSSLGPNSGGSGSRKRNGPQGDQSLSSKGSNAKKGSKG